MAAKDRNTSDWTLNYLEIALAKLKNNKARDNDGLINEIFKKEVIGDDLKMSLLKMFNKMKSEGQIANFMNTANITTVHKMGSRVELKNEHGIFRVSVVRSILMRMIYNDNYPVIDSNMSDCQMGARKNKGCKSNIWIINGIIHEALRSKNSTPIQLQTDV